MLCAATTSCTLSLEVLRAMQGDQFCVWHHKHNKGGGKHDHAEGPFQVARMPYLRLPDKMLKKMTADTERLQQVEI